jgi:hypothetical protein
VLSYLSSSVDISDYTIENASSFTEHETAFEKSWVQNERDLYTNFKWSGSDEEFFDTDLLSITVNPVATFSRLTTSDFAGNLNAESTKIEFSARISGLDFVETGNAETDLRLLRLLIKTQFLQSADQEFSKSDRNFYLDFEVTDVRKINRKRRDTVTGENWVL